MLPTRPIEKGIAGPGLLAHILMSKFVDHLPLYRQRQQFRRLGVEISGATMEGWVTSSCGLFLPLYEAHRQIIQHSSYLMADETPLPVYAFERQAREAGLSFEERYQLRQSQALPILAEIKIWLDANLTVVLPKSAIGKAIGYTLGQWSKLEKYVTDGRLEIDNNLVENAIRPVALGRKNYLFAGSHEGAKRAAIVYTLLATAKRHQVEPFAYLKDLLSRIPDYPHNQVADLLPQNWSPQKP